MAEVSLYPDAEIEYTQVFLCSRSLFIRSYHVFDLYFCVIEWRLYIV